MRAALYYAPSLDDPLHAAGSAWLGRDAETNAPVRQPDVPGIAEATADARGYGFHCTLKPPFRLAEGRSFDDLARAVEALAAGLAPFELPPLAVAEIGGFLALRETAECPAMRALADACVAGLDGFRAPAGAEELARRRRAGLSDVQEAMVSRWGYPHVFEAWFFHMTLTRRLTEAERTVFRPAVEAHFSGVAGAARRVGDVCVFTQAAAGAPFVIALRFALGVAVGGTRE